MMCAFTMEESEQNSEKRLFHDLRTGRSNRTYFVISFLFHYQI